MVGNRWATAVIAGFFYLLCGCQQSTQKPQEKPAVNLQQLEKDKRVDEWVMRIQQNSGWYAQMKLVRETVYYHLDETPYMAVAYRRILQRHPDQPEIIFGYILLGSVMDISIVSDLSIRVPNLWYPIICQDINIKLEYLLNKNPNDAFTYIAAIEACNCSCRTIEQRDYKKWEDFLKKVDPDNLYLTSSDKNLPLQEQARRREQAIDNDLYPIRTGLIFILNTYFTFMKLGDEARANKYKRMFIDIASKHSGRVMIREAILVHPELWNELPKSVQDRISNEALIKNFENMNNSNKNKPNR
jgi:hypothetical protein